MLNAIIVDDERPAIDFLKLLLERTGEIDVVGCYMCGTSALREAQTHKIDVAFLDIEMPDMSGLELAERLLEAGRDMEIVFVTAYDKYALDAFRANAIDYILKPTSPGDIAQTLAKLKKVRGTEQARESASDKGRIYCLGRLLVYGAGSDKPVKWRTAKAEELFAFLLLNLNEEVSKWRIMQVLWPEYETEKHNVLLHTSIYQVKKTLLFAKIDFHLTFRNGRYRLELPQAYIDVREFGEITGEEIALSEGNIDKYKRALSLYKGNFLADEYPWAQSRAEEYFIKYRGLACGFAQYYAEKEEFEAAEGILQEALEKAPLDDSMNEMMLKLYYMKKDKASLVLHYNRIQELYHTELGITPNAVMRSYMKRSLEL